MTDLDIFKQYVVEQEATTSGFTQWKTSSPGDYAKWVAYRNAIVAGGSPATPAMVTHTGKAMVLVASLLHLPPPVVVPPVGVYPKPDASFRKVAPGSALDLKSGDRVWLLPGAHREVYAKDLTDVEVIGDPAGGTTVAYVARNHCTRVNVRDLTVRETELPFHTYGNSDWCSVTNVHLLKSSDSGFMDEDSTNVFYDTVTVRDPGRGFGGPGYATHGMYMRCQGVIQNVKVYNAKGGGISLRRQNMILKNAWCDSKCDIGLSFYSFTTAEGKVMVMNSTFGGVTADVWISDEYNGPTPTIGAPVGPHPTFYFINVNYSGVSRDKFNYGAGIAANIIQKDIHDLGHLV